MFSVSGSDVVRLCLPVILAWIAITADCVEAKEPGVIFSVRDYTKSGITYSGSGKNIKFLIEPFAYVSNGKLIKLPENIDLTQFDKDYYSNHHRYSLYLGGRIGGSVEVVQSAFDIQCESLAAVAMVTPPGKISGMRMAVASNVDFKNMDYVRRAPADLEKAIIWKLAKRIYVKNKIPEAVMKEVRTSNVTVFEGASGSMLVGSFFVNQMAKVDGYDMPVTHAAFVVAEKSGIRPYKATLTWFHSGGENEVETQDLVDVLDIDGDGMPEIVTQFGYYEAVEYHAYRKNKKNGEWEDFYQNFGAGC